MTRLALALLVCVLSGCGHWSPYVSPSLDDRAAGELRIDPESVRSRVLLIGDAGAPAADQPVLAELADWGDELPGRTTIVFLGDNVYPWGLVEEGNRLHTLTAARLAAQLQAVSASGARGIFIPGNHDWAHGGEAGLRTLLRQERVVTGALGAGSFLPTGGCAGPDAIDLDGLRLVVFDSQRFLQVPPMTPCGETEEQVARQIGELAGSAGDREVIVVAHHPLVSYGVHGSFYDWRDHLFPFLNLAPWAWIPLPVAGSLYPLTRSALDPSSQDLGHADYQAFVTDVEEAARPHKPLAYAGAHDHSLQVLDGGEAFDYMLVSGAGSAPKIATVGVGEDTLFAHAAAGFMAIDVLDDGRIALRVVEPGRGVVFSHWLLAE